MRFTIIMVIFIGLVSGFQLSAQKLSVKLQWQENIVISSKDFSYEVLHFSGADYTGEFKKIPVYSLTVPLKKNNAFETFKAELQNIRFQKCTARENELLKDTQITDSFRLSIRRKEARGDSWLAVKLIPLRKNASGGFEKLISGDIIYKGIKPKSAYAEKADYRQNSVLSQGTWFRLKIKETGLYKITYDELREIGIQSPENVRVFGNDAGMLSMRNDGSAPDDLLENHIVHKDQSVLFYAKGPHVWDFDENNKIFRHRDHLYSDALYYYFSSDYNSGDNNQVQNATSVSQTPDFTIDYFHDYQRINKEEVNLAKTGRRFYGDLFDITLSRDYFFEFPDLRTDRPAKLAIAVAASAGSTSYFVLKAGNFSANISVPSLISYYNARRAEEEFEFFPSSKEGIALNLSYDQRSPSYSGWLDFIELNVSRELRVAQGLLHFRNTDAYGPGTVSEYVIANASADMQVWDITNSVKPKIMPTDFSGTQLRFKAMSDELREYIVFRENDILRPDITTAEAVENQNLHAVSPDVDLVIVSHPLFYSQAQELKSMREQEGLNVFLCTPENIYHEFSSGAPDISAIRNFMKMLYDKAPSREDAVKYLLLFGDGSYDNKGDFKENTNYILSYQSRNSVGQTSSYFSDDFFGLLDEGEGDSGSALTGLLDIGVGRIPVSSAGQASDFLKKLKNYENPKTFGSWRNRLSFAADDEDGNVHMNDADTLTRYVDELYPWYNISKIYLDAYKQETGTGGERYPAVNHALNSEILKGTLLFNYTGHGGVKGLAHERIMTVKDIESWKNFDKLPLFVTATCEFTRFDDYGFLSAGERVFLSPKGGAVAMFTTARLAYIHSNAALTKAFYKYVFEPYDTDGKTMRLGDVIRRTKIERGGAVKDLIFFLLGDPSMRLGYARQNAVTEKINGQAIENHNDTIKALTKVKFEGRIETSDGQIMKDFSGKVYPTVFDKKQEVNTLNNDGEGVWTYRDRTNMIFRGQSSVKNGRFEFEFIVPRDIFLNIGNGKVSYYATDGYTTAKGAEESFLIGGIGPDSISDSQGPEINLYMNDENFVSGGTTDSNPVLLAKFWDESGINTAAGAVGHDITAVLDEDIQNTYSLNNDYTADTDTYQSGSLRHFLFDIEEGDHRIKLKARDVLNNSSEAFLDFTVISEADLVIKHLLNYPNPFTTSTTFYFEHNRAYDRLDILIQVFTPSGRLVKTIRETVDTQGYRAGPFYWDGTDDFGQRIGRGAYIYKLKIRSSDGQVKEEYQKLLILK